MKSQFLLIICLLNGIVFYAQQSVKVTYKAAIGTTTMDEDSKKALGDYADVLSNMTAETTKRKMEILKDLNFILKANPDESLYFWEEEIPDETISTHTFNSAVMVGGGNQVHYQNKKENLYFYQYKDLNGKWVREYEPLNNRKWKITKEKDTLLGYLVLKAVYTKKLNIKSPNPLIKTSYTETAWFAPEIPLPFGPSGAGGLPGLVLKYQMGNRVIYADKIKFLKKRVKIKRPSKGKLVSIEEATAKRMNNLNKMIQD